MADSSSKRRSVDLPGRHLKLKLVLGPGFPARNLLKRNQAESGEWITAYKAEQTSRLKAVLKSSKPGKSERSKVTLPPANTREASSLPRSILDRPFLLLHCYAKCPSDLSVANISASKLKDYNSDHLQEFDNVVSVDASDNHLPFEAFSAFPSLQALELSLNFIKDLFVEIGDFPNLHSLDLSYNNLNGGSLLVLGTLPALKELRLTGNNLVALPVEMSMPYVVEGGDEIAQLRFPVLEKLWLDDNKFSDQTTFATLAGLRVLEYLNLDNNEIYIIPHLKLLGTSPLKRNRQSSNYEGERPPNDRDSPIKEIPTDKDSGTVRKESDSLSHRIISKDSRTSRESLNGRINRGSPIERESLNGRIDRGSPIERTSKESLNDRINRGSPIERTSRESLNGRINRGSPTERTSRNSPNNRTKKGSSPNNRDALPRLDELITNTCTASKDSELSISRSAPSIPGQDARGNAIKTSSSFSEAGSASARLNHQAQGISMRENTKPDSIPQQCEDAPSHPEMSAELVLMSGPNVDQNQPDGGDEERVRGRRIDRTVEAVPLSPSADISINMDFIPFPALKKLSLVNNLILSSEGVIACVPWPSLQEISIYNNPLTRTSNGMPPLLQEYLVDQLGINVLRMEPGSPRRHEHIKEIVKDLKKISSAPPPTIPRYPLPALAAPPLSHLPALDHSPSSHTHSFSPSLSSQQSLNSASESSFSQESDEGPGIFMTQVAGHLLEGEGHSKSPLPDEEQCKEQDVTITRSISAKEAFQSKLKDLKIKYKNVPDKYKGYEILLDLEDDPSDNIPSDIHGCTRALQYALKHPLAMADYQPTLHVHPNAIQRNRRESTKSGTISSDVLSSKLLSLKQVLNDIRTQSLGTETNLAAALEPKNEDKKKSSTQLQRDAKKLFDEMQSHYNQVRASSLCHVSANHRTIQTNTSTVNKEHNRVQFKGLDS